MMSRPLDFGRRLRTARHSHRLSLCAMARLAGIAPIRLSWYERGRAIPRRPTLLRLLTVLDLTEQELAMFPPFDIVERSGRKPESPYGTPRPHGRPSKE